MGKKEGIKSGGNEVSATQLSGFFLVKNIPKRKRRKWMGVRKFKNKLTTLS